MSLSSKVLFFLLFFGSCFQHTGFGSIIQHDPDRQVSVFQTQLDNRSRALVLDLGDMLVAYDMKLGALYKVWKGEVERPSGADSLLYKMDTVSRGLTYLEQDTASVWRAFRAGEEIIPEFIFNGYQIQQNQVTLSYSLRVPGGEEIQILEHPALLLDDDGRPGLVREFYTTNVPPDVQVTLHVNAVSLSDRNDLAYEGFFHRLYTREEAYTWGETLDLSGRLVLAPDTTSKISIFFNPGVLRLVRNLSANTSLMPARGIRLSLPGQLDSASVFDSMPTEDLDPGGIMKVYSIGRPIRELVSLAPGQWPNVFKSGISLDLDEKEDFGGEGFYFVSEIQGYFDIVTSGYTRFRLEADDGARVKIGDRYLFDGELISVSDGARIDSLYMEAGRFPLHLEHFQSTGPRVIRMEWMPASDSVWHFMDHRALLHDANSEARTSSGKKWFFQPSWSQPDWPAASRIAGMHPRFRFSPVPITPLKETILGNIDQLPDGRFVALTKEHNGSVYLVDVEAGTATPFAEGLDVPMGLIVVEDSIFVLQKNELTRLIDGDLDGYVDEFQVVADGWEVSPSAQEVATGLVYHDGSFYATLNVPLNDEGTPFRTESSSRGRLVRMTSSDGHEELDVSVYLSDGMVLVNDRLMISDFHSKWMPGSRFVFSDKLNEEQSTLPADEEGAPGIWMPERSEPAGVSSPIVLRQEPYAGQVLYNDSFSETLYRVYVEEVEGVPQGSVFRMSGDGVIRTGSMLYDQNGRIWATNGGYSERWGRTDTSRTALNLLEWQETEVFEMLRLSTLATGFEISLSDSLIEEQVDKNDFRVYRWTFKDHIWENGVRPEWVEERLEDVRVSPDRQKLFLDLPALKAGSRYYISVPLHLQNKQGENIFSNEVWVTVNRLPATETLVRSEQ